MKRELQVNGMLKDDKRFMVGLVEEVGNTARECVGDKEEGRTRPQQAAWRSRIWEWVRVEK